MIKEAIREHFTRKNNQEERIDFFKAEDIYIQNNQFDPDVMIGKLISNTERAISEGHNSLLAGSFYFTRLRGYQT